MFGKVGGYKEHLEQPRPLKIEYLRKIKPNPLFSIIKCDVFKEWKIYGEVKTIDENKELLKNCFTTDEEDYEDSILLKTINHLL